jgi:hypothetical protein
MQDSVLREQLVELLSGGEAHIKPDAALEGVGARFRNVRPSPGTRSIWEMLEHMRIAQEDILRYTLDPDWKSPEWTAGYWPAENQDVSDEMWKASLDGFFSDLQEVIKLVEDPNVDLTATIPHGEWRTYLREVLLIADHNAYHLGQIVQARKLLGDWPE